ncbi:unnamed protein product [Ectocarpus sp. CCAP 1310/34]|nr:unnamed protein product [Ectocarpus sp. CCAP 1310/34]
MEGAGMSSMEGKPPDDINKWNNKGRG